MSEFEQEAPAWVPRKAVDAMHHAQLLEHGGAFGLRDANVLEAALARPQQRHHYEPESDAATLAAAYAFGLVKAHAFADGNKRIAYVTALVFLEMNGYTFNADDDEAEAKVLGLAAGEVSEEQFAAWLRAGMTPLSADDTEDLAGP